MRQIQQYRNKISGPLLDRIDIHVEVPSIGYKELSSVASGESSQVIRERVKACREIQRERFKGLRKILSNSGMTGKQMQKHCCLPTEARDMLKNAISELNFSARAYDRILKVARTIADLDASEEIKPQHICEAIQYRTLDRQVWA